MTDYVKSTNFASKDSLAIGNPLKIVKGTEIDTEFNNIATAVATKADLNSPAFIGTPTLPTGAIAVTQSAGNNTTAVATTAFVKTAIDNYDAALTVSTSQIENNAVTNDKLAVGAAVANLGFTPADSTATVNLTGDQTVAGTKTFTAGVRFNDGTTQTTAAVSPNTTNVLNATAGASTGAVGTYALLGLPSGEIVSPGTTFAGSSLRWSNAQGTHGSAPSGTWRLLGSLNSEGGSAGLASVWLRIS